MHLQRRTSYLDCFLEETGHFLQTVFAKPVAQRSNPANTIADFELSASEQKHVAGLIRVDHTGEICAQALYRGQALTAKTQTAHDALHQAAQEENDHLAWCEQRLTELHSHASYLNIAWYIASFKLGAVAGLLGDGFSMGFVQETEHQVVKHIDEHLKSIPRSDEKSQAILTQMRIDEAQHATMALKKGAKPLPSFIKTLMRLKSKVMTHTAYYV